MTTQLAIIPFPYVRQLKASLDDDPKLIDIYRSAAAFPIESGKLIQSPILPQGGPPTLSVKDSSKAVRAKDDAENAIKVYRWLGQLSRVQAADPRLWITLTHTTFFDYVRDRWPELKVLEDPKARGYVDRHWFLGASGKARLRTNAISRLWWAAHLTYKPWNQDPELKPFATNDEARFTEILLRNQQIYFDLIERDLGSSLKVRICFLDAIEKSVGSVSSVDSLSRECSKTLNLIARTKNLDAMPVQGMRELFAQIVATEVASQGVSEEAAATAT